MDAAALSPPAQNVSPTATIVDETTREDNTLDAALYAFCRDLFEAEKKCLHVKTPVTEHRPQQEG